VLDLCCGWGRHAQELAQLDYHVTGLDRDPCLGHFGHPTPSSEAAES